MSRRPITRQTLADQIADQLRADICSGQFEPGDPLPSQRRLSAEFGASTHVVREAVRTLQAAGLIEIRHGAGMFVAERALPPTIEELDHHTIIEARCMLEVGAVERVIQNIDDAGFARLEAILERARQKLAAGQAVAEEELDFHAALLELSGNAAVAQLAAVIEEFFRQSIRGQPPETVGHYPQFVPEHRQIVELIRAGDVRAARRALRRHILTGAPRGASNRARDGG